MLDEKLVPKIGSTVGSAGARSVDCDRNASPSEISRHPFKAPWDDGLTAWTGPVAKLEVRMECGEVERHIRTQRLHQPFTELGDFALGIIMARDEQSGDLKPNARLMMEILQRLQHRLQV